jgi:hypothetical protein
VFVSAALAALFCGYLAAQTPANSAAGLWQVTNVSAGPWSIELMQNETKLTGTVRQAGAEGGPVTISEGAVTGNTLTFKAVSPDGARTITFTGTLKGDEIAFKRSVEVRNNNIGPTGVFGGRAISEFTAKRVNAVAVSPTGAGLRGAPAPRGAARSVPVNPTNSPDGRWIAIAVGGGPWTFEFKSDGVVLNGSVRQSASPDGPIAIADGRIDGTRITFRVMSPDGARTITFVGRVNAGEISFVRQFGIERGASSGSNDLYGPLSALQFVAKRVAQ